MCVGRAYGPLTAVGFCTGTSVLPRSSLCRIVLQLQLSWQAFAFPLTQGKRLVRKKKKEALCIMQQILARTYSVGFKKKAKKNANLLLLLSFSAESCIPSVSPRWHMMLIF